MIPIEKLDALVEGYMSEHNSEAKTFLLEMDRVPENLRKLIGLYVPAENIDKWLDDKEAFEGQSPTEYLSKLDSCQLRRNVSKIVDTFYGVLSMATVPELPTTEEVIYATRLAQCQQLKLVKK